MTQQIDYSHQVERLISTLRDIQSELGYIGKELRLVREERGSKMPKFEFVDMEPPTVEQVAAAVGEAIQVPESNEWWWSLCATVGCWHGPKSHEDLETRLGGCIFCTCREYAPRVKGVNV